MASESAPPDRVFLNLENVRGTHDATVLSVYLNLPEGARPSDHPELLAGSVGLFGLRRAEFRDGHHGGQSLNFVLEITKIVDARCTGTTRSMPISALRADRAPSAGSRSGGNHHWASEHLP